MARNVLVHLNVELSDDDPRTDQDVTIAIAGAIQGGSDDPNMDGLAWSVAMYEEI